MLIHLVVMIKSIANMQRELTDSRFFKNMVGEIDRLNPNVHTVPLMIILYADEYEQSKKKEIGSLFLQVGNLPRRLRLLKGNTFFLGMYESWKDFYSILNAIVDELNMLSEGINMYCSRYKCAKKVVCRIPLFLADSQMRWKIACTNPPSWMCEYQCNYCEIPRDDFGLC